MTDELVSALDRIKLTDVDIQKPFLKWVGGKTQIIHHILNTFPKKINTYHEIFVGGGSVLLALLSLQATNEIEIKNEIRAYDLNEGLINVYKNIQTHPEELYDELSIYYKKINELTGTEVNRKPNNFKDAETSQESYYYWIRQTFNQIQDITSLEYSAKFIFLNKTCFRGLYREGPRGFNVPYGHYKSFNIIPKQELTAISTLLKPVEFVCSDFASSMKNCIAGDFVYLDPPYAPEDSKSFVGYNKEGFDLDQHTTLFKMINEFTTSNISFVMSNSNVDMVNDSFTTCSITTVDARRAINSKKPGSKTKEVIIQNF